MKACSQDRRACSFTTQDKNFSAISLGSCKEKKQTQYDILQGADTKVWKITGTVLGAEAICSDQHLNTCYIIVDNFTWTKEPDVRELEAQTLICVCSEKSVILLL